MVHEITPRSRLAPKLAYGALIGKLCLGLGQGSDQGILESPVSHLVHMRVVTLGGILLAQLSNTRP